MIEFARRTSYFGPDDTYWVVMSGKTLYKDVSFINWVFKIDGIIYTHCLSDFKETFEKAVLWERLH